VFGEKTFKVTVPDDAKITFGPWSPPSRNKNGYENPDPAGKKGTLRIYRGSEKNILAVFSGVTSFRDVSLDYSEMVAVEQGATIWKNDAKGYEREDKITRQNTWVEGKALVADTKKEKN
jgi:hypothetical protein